MINKQNIINDTPRTDAVTLVKCYCPRCIVGMHDDMQLAAQYRKHAEWRERAEKAEAEVEKLDKERRELSRELHLWEMGMYYKPKMQAKIDELKAEVERLMSRIDRINNDNFNFANALSKAEAEVERIRGLVNESIVEKSNLSIALVNCQADVERLRSALQSCWWATNTYDGNYTRACDNVATIAIAALKTQDK